jgi:hypothetical protein
MSCPVRPSSAKTSRAAEQRARRARRCRRGRCTHPTLARAVAPTPRQRISGCAQWWPARMHTPSRLHSSATSCGWMPSSVNETSAAAVLGLGRADHAQAGDARQASSAYAVSERSCSRTRSMPSADEVVDRGCRARRPRRHRGARLELPRQLVPRRALEVDRGDHVAARQERLHLLEQLAAAVQHADARRPERLVARPRVEVGADLLDVDPHLRHRLRAVDQRHRARPHARARTSRRPG